MNDLKIFECEEFGAVRLTDILGKTYFSASDVAKALGYSNPRAAIIRHCKGVMKRDGASEAQVKARMAAQMSDEERCRRAHYIINNDGNSDVEGALRDIWVKIDRGRLRED